ncbi:MAG: hypothetical protein WBL68_00465 [Nitrososphaeraceae archaeon]
MHRFTYDAAAYTIGEPADLINGFSGSTDHNSGRMTFGPDGKLYYMIGDQGKNYLKYYTKEFTRINANTAKAIKIQQEKLQQSFQLIVREVYT